MKNWLVTGITFFLSYVLLEFFCLNIFFRLLPHGAYPLLDEGVSFVLQSSKKSVTPRDYIAILGDSYAMGLGDAYYDTAAAARAEYGSAPFLHRGLGRDVISFGTAGNSSISALVTQPTLALKFFNRGWRTSLEAPRDILVYFYEGNDFSDNVEYPHYSRKRVPFRYDQLDDPVYLDSYIEAAAIIYHPWNQKIEQMHGYDQLYLAKFIARASMVLFAEMLRRIQDNPSDPSQEIVAVDSPLNLKGRYGWISPGDMNRAMINGEERQIPDKVQGPSSLSLTEEEKKLSLLSYAAALRSLKKKFPQSVIRVVYVPSVISSYEIVSSRAHLQNYRREQGLVYPVEQVQAASNWGAEKIRQLTEAESILFIDARPALRQVTRTQYVHGPKDWNHFNQAGYSALADAILKSFTSTKSR